MDWEKLFKKLKNKNVSYLFFKLSNDTDMMTDIFANYYSTLCLNKMCNFRVEELANYDKHNFVKMCSQFIGGNITKSMNSISFGDLSDQIHREAKVKPLIPML
mmetsp:Transcript_41690/g.37103  ORF Transcript_41690/g.37103 Transcript_41690/m.37103 type:complete len:103 (-) Transcript_41690:1106-1414(-)